LTGLLEQWDPLSRSSTGRSSSRTDGHSSIVETKNRKQNEDFFLARENALSYNGSS
jgi:hypothetical protein